MDYRFWVFVILSFFCFACGDSTPDECPNIESTSFTAEVNGENLLLKNIEVREDVIPNLDTYLFLIDAISRDCNQLFKFQFYASVPNSTDLAGSFEIVETIVYTASQLTSFTYTIETLEPQDFNIRYAIGGECTIEKHAENDYSLEIKAELPEKDEVRLNVRHQF